MKLKNIKLAFGGVTSPTALSATQINTLLRVVQDSELTTKRFSGYVSCLEGIKGSEAWVLGQNGVTYVGTILPETYSVEPLANTVTEGNEVAFSVNGVPQEAIAFSVDTVTVNEGDVDADYVKALLSFNGNKLVVAKGSNIEGWSASVRVKAIPKYPSVTVQYATVTTNGRVAAKSLSASNISFSKVESKTVSVSYAPLSYNIPIVKLEATLPEGVTEYVIREAEPYSLRVECINLSVVRECDITLKATDAEGNVIMGRLAVSNKVIPVITFNAGEIKAKMGVGSKYVEFIFNPTAYNVPVAVQNVTSSNSAITVSDISNSGFKLNVEGISADATATIIATFSADGKNVTATGSVSVKYVEDDRPFILINTSDSEVSFMIEKGSSNTLDCNYAIVSDYAKGDEFYNFGGVVYTNFTTTQTFTIPAHASIFLYSDKMIVWGSNNSASYYSNTFKNIPAAIDFDGNIMSLLKGGKFSGNYAFSYLFSDCKFLVNAPKLPATTLANDCYESMFSGCTSLVNAPELPATTLSSYCYNSMFRGCTSLANAPALPATTLADYCYLSMFSGCTSLVNAPALPATTLSNSCYNSMFQDCKSLVNAPVLPATTLSSSCYDSMFYGCTSLVNAPELPATTLSSYCYNSMFRGCTSLTTAPELPATTLLDNCYSEMFRGCTSLTTAPAVLPATTLAGSCYYRMFQGCTSLTNAPELPATTLNNNCCAYMFSGCTSLVNAPELPATTLLNNCYNEMFKGCTSLTTAPAVLPATTLAGGCYYRMFQGCTSLTNAPELPATKLASMCYNEMFAGCTSLVSAPKLPATKLSDYCYSSMFSDCTSLVNAPELPAKTLNEYCYRGMFYNCTSLVTAPKLQATTLRDRCCYSMFQGCTSLVNAPELPATTLASNCYNSMFSDCTSLTSAPVLPATTLAYNCYSSMFRSCTSLTTAPELPATTLVSDCYNSMFERCEKLNYIKMLATDISASGSLSYWVTGVSSSGTFVKHSSMTSLTTGTSGIPSGWTVLDSTD